MKRTMYGMLGAVLVCGLMLLTGCSGGGGGSASTGTLQVALTDAPSHDFAEVWIRVKAIKVVPVEYDQNATDDDPALIDIPLDPALLPYSFNVLDLAYVQQLLGQAVLPAGTYSQVRLILEPNPSQGDPVNYVVLNGETAKIPLKSPSAQQSGLKVLGRFVVEPGVINAIAIDFDPNTAIVERGNTQQSEKYLLKPTGIRIIQLDDILATYKSISGTVTAQDPSSWTSAIVSVIPQGQTSAIAAGALFNTYTSAGWAPFTTNIPATPPATYRVHVRSEGFRLYSSSPISTLSFGNHTSLGTITLQPLP